MRCSTTIVASAESCDGLMSADPCWRSLRLSRRTANRNRDAISGNGALSTSAGTGAEGIHLA